MSGLVPRRKSMEPGALVRAAQDAIERRVQTGPNQMGLQQSRLLARALTWSLIGCTGFGLAWLTFAQTEEVVVAPGKLEPIGEVKTIQVPLGGVLDQVLVTDGQRVRKGQILLRLDQEATKDRETSLQKTVEAKQQQLKLKEVELQRYLALNDTEQEVLRQYLAMEQEVLKRFNGLQRFCSSETSFVR
jgi:hemolysin D